MDKIKIALIGAGGMANGVHYPSLAAFDDVKLVGLCDLVPSKLQETAERFQIAKTFADYKQMLETTSPDAVYVLMPPQHLFAPVIHSLITRSPRLHRKTPRRNAPSSKRDGAGCRDNTIAKRWSGLIDGSFRSCVKSRGSSKKKDPSSSVCPHSTKTPQAPYTTTVSSTC